MTQVKNKARKDKGLKPHRNKDTWTPLNVPKAVTLELHSEMLLRLGWLSGNSTVKEKDVYKGLKHILENWV